jgi:hypothetical protein
MANPLADQSAVGAIMQMNEINWEVAVGAINRAQARAAATC